MVLLRILVAGLVVIAAPAAADATAAPATAAPATARADYRLAPGDRLRITVFGEEGLSGEYGLTSAGNVAFPLIGSVPAAGTTVEALQEAIRARLAAGYLNDPKVSAEVIAYRPYYILGEVTHPGAFPYAIGLTLDQAVASAGGFTYRANHRRAFVRRAGTDREVAIDLRHGPVAIGPGDTVRIGERYF